MAKRIEKPVVGKTYWDSGGDECTVLFIEGDIAIVLRRFISGGPYSSTVVRSCGEWPLYDADPTKPKPLPALDLTKPVKFRNGTKVIRVTPSPVHPNWLHARYGDDDEDFVAVQLDGRLNTIAADSDWDLLQCVRRDWTQADVPFPWPVFRERENATHLVPDCMYAASAVSRNGVSMFSYAVQLHRSFSVLSAGWEYTVDGKAWNACCIWE
jgi:hypothetical protein